MTEPWFAADTPPSPPVHRLWVEAISAVTPMPRRVALAAARGAPPGDGHPVLVLPAFLRGDRYMLPLRRFVGNCGYAVAAWGLGVNVGATDAILARIARRPAAWRIVADRLALPEGSWRPYGADAEAQNSAS